MSQYVLGGIIGGFLGFLFGFFTAAMLALNADEKRRKSRR